MVPKKIFKKQAESNSFREPLKSKSLECLKQYHTMPFLTLIIYLGFPCTTMFSNVKYLTKENRIYNRVDFRQSLGINFVSPIQPERELKVYKSCKCSQII